MICRIGRTVVGLLLVGALTACADDTLSSPSGQLAGTWSGTITGGSNTGAATLVLTQSGAGVTGTYAVTWPDIAQNRTGITSGTTVAGLVTLALTPATPLACGSLVLTGTMTMTLAFGGNRLSGSYSSVSCGGAVTGNVDLVRG